MGYFTTVFSFLLFLFPNLVEYYIRVGDYYIPNLVLDPEPAESPKTVGKYGSLRRT